MIRSLSCSDVFPSNGANACRGLPADSTVDLDKPLHQQYVAQSKSPFRPQYGKLYKLVFAADVPVVAMTATIPHKVRLWWIDVLTCCLGERTSYAAPGHGWTSRA